MTVIQSTPIFIFLYPVAPTVNDAISVVATGASVELVLRAESVFLDAQIYEKVFPSSVSLYLNAVTPSVDIYRRRVISTERRLHRSAWQGRLGARLDPIKRKLLDNNILLSAHPTDMLRVRVTRDSRTQDILTRTIVASEVLPVMLPVMKDVPMRRLVKDDASSSIVATFSMLEDQKPFEAFCPISGQLQRDDLLFRIIKDPYADLPYIMVLQVKDELATFSYASLLYVKYMLSFYDEPLPQAVVSEIMNASEKREVLKW